jgi:hypothetical protein
MPIRIPQTLTAIPTPAAPKRPLRVRRWVYHAMLFAASAAGGGALLVWPQWIALDGSRNTLQIQQDRERELTDRLETARAMTDRLRLWDREGRRVFLTSEVARYPLMAAALGKREGAAQVKAEVTQASSSRWRAVTLDKSLGAVDDAAGEIRPQLVRVTARGNFDRVYRTVAGLTQQQQLFIPERWQLVGSPGGELKAEILGTVFVVHQPEDEPVGTPAASVGPVASAAVEGRG